MSITATGWPNKGGTGDRACKCGTWKQLWISFANKSWSGRTSGNIFNRTSTLGAHVINLSFTGERIVPMCDSCNKFSDTISLKCGVTVPSANKLETLSKRHKNAINTNINYSLFLEENL